jgi:hypothetical protein
MQWEDRKCFLDFYSIVVHNLKLKRVSSFLLCLGANPRKQWLLWKSTVTKPASVAFNIAFNILILVALAISHLPTQVALAQKKLNENFSKPFSYRYALIIILC